MTLIKYQYNIGYLKFEILLSNSSIRPVSRKIIICIINKVIIWKMLIKVILKGIFESK